MNFEGDSIIIALKMGPGGRYVKGKYFKNELEFFDNFADLHLNNFEITTTYDFNITEKQKLGTV